jgi:hypothetical protein
MTMTRSRARVISMAVALLACWVLNYLAGREFADTAVEVFNRQKHTEDFYVLIDAREAFSSRIIFIIPFFGFVTYWLTRLMLAAPQWLANYLARARARRNAQTTI